MVSLQSFVSEPGIWIDSVELFKLSGCVLGEFNLTRNLVPVVFLSFTLSLRSEQCSLNILGFLPLKTLAN